MCASSEGRRRDVSHPMCHHNAQATHGHGSGWQWARLGQEGTRNASLLLAHVPKDAGEWQSDQSHPEAKDLRGRFPEADSPPGLWCCQGQHLGPGLQAGPGRHLNGINPACLGYAPALSKGTGLGSNASSLTSLHLFPSLSDGLIRTYLMQLLWD